MKIKSIEIKNFRSIVDASFNVDNLNIFVGQNNCGKTNFFEAIDFFFSGVPRGAKVDNWKYKREYFRELSVRIEFENAQDGLTRMQNATNKTKIEKALNGEDVVTLVRTSKEPGKRKMFVAGNEVVPGIGFDAALNDFLPKFEYVNTKQYYDSVAKYSKTSPIGIMLSGVLSTILEKNTQYQEFQNKFKELFENDDSEIKAEFERVGGKVKLHLEKQFPDCVSVRFDVSAPQFDDLLKNFDTTVDDGIETLAEEKGDGMQRALMLAIIQSYADFRKDSTETGKSFLFFIDEAELHLHPTAQRKLKDVLLALSERSDQVFINTHSSIFVADDRPGQMILKVEKSDGETSIEETTALQKPYIVYELLGGSPSDLLLPKNFLIVEGQSEIEFLMRVIARFYIGKPPIQIIKANGDIDQAERTIGAIEQVFSPLSESIYKNKLVLLIDKPSREKQLGVDEFNRKNRHLATNNQFFELPFRDLEQYYPSQADPTYGNWRKSQLEVDGMKGRKKVQLAKFVGSNITREQFETEMPMCYEALTRTWENAY